MSGKTIMVPTGIISVSKSNSSVSGDGPRAGAKESKERCKSQRPSGRVRSQGAWQTLEQRQGKL